MKREEPNQKGPNHDPEGTRRDFVRNVASAALGAAIIGDPLLAGGQSASTPVASVQGFIVPTADIVILTDSQQTAGVFITPKPSAYKGTMLTRGAVRLLFASWFQNGTAQLPPVGALLQAPAIRASTSLSQIGGFVEQLGRGVTFSSISPSAQGVTQSKSNAGQRLQVPGLNPLLLREGQYLTRKIGSSTVVYHVTTAQLPTSAVTIIDRPVAIAADIVELPEEMQLQRARVIMGANGCSGCAACAACAFCTVCGEANAAVGLAGTMGLAGLVGLASSVRVQGMPR